MSGAIGENFYNELVAAGVAGLPFSWTPGTGEILYDAAMTTEQCAAVAAVYAAHDPMKPDPNIAAPALLVIGIALTSTGAPALNGTYAADPVSEQRIVAESLSIQVSGKFTNGQATRAWYDTSGAGHSFDAAHFIAFAEAVGQFVDAVLAALAASLPSGVSWIAPSNAYTIG